ncbi:MAG: metal-dependent hydrolase [Pseudomonadota bacterium]
MITAHLPSGYVLWRALSGGQAVAIAAIAGALAPDLDLIWFYTVDARAIHHPRYWVHAPTFALVVSALALGLGKALRPSWTPIILAFAIGWLLHIALDSIAGGIMWLWPVSDTLFALIEVPATYSHFLISFLLHPSFLLELAVWVVALWLWFRR